MKVVIYAGGEILDSELEFGDLPRELFPLLDRPLIQHLVENLVSTGAQDFEFLLSRHPEKFENLLDDGRRWGSRFNFHLLREPEQFGRLLRTLAETSDKDEKFLLIQADLFPEITPSHIERSRAAINELVFVLQSAEGVKKWAGAILLTSSSIKNLFRSNDTLESVAAKLIEFGNAEIITAERSFKTESYSEILKVQREFFDLHSSRNLLTARETAPGIWLSRNVVLHPTAKITEPVFIGENCRVGADSEIGPNAVISANCLIEKKCTITNSLIVANSYIGENLEISDSVVGKGRIANTRLGAQIGITDQFIVGNLYEPEIKKFAAEVFRRLAALFLLIPALPVLAAAYALLKLRSNRDGKNFKFEEAVRLPAKTTENRLATFQKLSFGLSEDDGKENTGASNGEGKGATSEMILRHLPALYNVFRGEMRFVGVRPLSRSQVDALPTDWRQFYLKCKPGIITDAMARFGEKATAEELFLSESVYAVTADWRTDLNILRQFVKNYRRNYVASAAPKKTRLDLKIN